MGEYMMKNNDWRLKTEQIESISCKEDFIEFIRSLVSDYTDNNSEWENKTVPEYLEQIAAWLEDYANSPANDAAWDTIDFRPLAKMMYMGKIYE